MKWGTVQIVLTGIFGNGRILGFHSSPFKSFWKKLLKMGEYFSFNSSPPAPLQKERGATRSQIQLPAKITWYFKTASK